MTRRAKPEDIADFFDSRVECCTQGRVEKAIWDRGSSLLRSSLSSVVTGRSVLELGCGQGKLLRDLARAGASSGMGIDLSPASVAVATQRASEEGLADRFTFQAGNAATTPLPSHDVVVLDKVICCFPDHEDLLANSLPAAAAVYAFTLPRTDGVWVPILRSALAVENLSHVIRRRGFRAYVHDERVIHRAVVDAGFRLRERRTAFAWALRVYERA